MTETVTILMATRNGAAHLAEQLASLAAQSHGAWRLWIGDDGSTDATRAIVRAFASAHPARDIRLIEGPRIGAAANFLSLLCRADLPAGPVALCDQDDVWLRGKLARALRRIEASAQNGAAAIYAAESWRCDARLRNRHASRSPRRAPGFANALVQNLCAGHTIVLNAAAVALVRRAGAPPGIAFHDWWLYQIVTGAGGRCLLDPAPVALYRQHAANAMGAAGSARSLVRRAALIGTGSYAGWLRAHHEALARSGVLAADAQQMVTALLTTRNRARTLRDLGIRRDRRLGTAALLCAAALGRA